MDYGSSIDPIMNNLRNYELMLYGGSNYGTAAPSYTNNYMCSTPMFNSYSYPYGNFNYMNGYNPSFNGYGNVNTGATSTAFQGLSDEDAQALMNYHTKSLSPSESILGAAAGGASMGLMNNPRIIVHPINTFNATKETNKIFANCKKEGTDLYKLWRGKETNGLMQDAYAAMNKLEARKYKKLGAFRKRFTSKAIDGTAGEYDRLRKIMEDALRTGKPEEIAKATATLKQAYVTDGWLATPVKKAWKTVSKPLTAIKESFFGKSAPVDKAAELTKMSNEMLETSKGLSFKKAIAKGGIFGPLFFFAIDFLMGKDKIKTAFSKDSSTGWKQVRQTTIKSIGSAAGWAAGEAAAIWAMGKAGAAIGTAFGPGIGTIIGGLVGVVGGSIGMCLAGKVTKAFVGQDAADQVETEKLASTPEGQAQLVQYAYEKAQAGEKMDARTQQALQRALNYYA